MIKGIIYDFDGVMTDNSVLISESGEELVSVNRSDGLGIRLLGENGFPQLVLSTEMSGLASVRAEKLGLQIKSGSTDKAADLLAWAFENDLRPSDIAFVGNDVNDLPALNACGFPIIVNDAFLTSPAQGRFFRLSRPGGRGAIRELAGFLLNPQGESASLRQKEFDAWVIDCERFHYQ